MANRVLFPSKDEIRKQFEEKFPARSTIPTPRGWRMLVMMPKPNEKSKGGIILDEAYLDKEVVASPIGYVVAQGPDCYKDQKKFPNGPWCSEGDLIFFRSYTGTRVVLQDTEFRVIADESVEATLDDPRGIERI